MSHYKACSYLRMKRYIEETQDGWWRSSYAPSHNQTLKWVELNYEIYN
ncbi:hypothetical protein ACFPFV_09480 [Salinicoccus siamensis]